MTSHGLLYRNCINITNMWHFLEMLDYNHWNSQRIKKATLQQKVNTQLTSHGLLYRNCTNNTNMWHFLPRKRYNWKKLKKINLTKWDPWTKRMASLQQLDISGVQSQFLRPKTKLIFLKTIFLFKFAKVNKTEYVSH